MVYLCSFTGLYYLLLAMINNSGGTSIPIEGVNDLKEDEEGEKLLIGFENSEIASEEEKSMSVRKKTIMFRIFCCKLTKKLQ